MRFLLTTLAVLAALLLIGVSGSMNFLFMSGLAKSSDEAIVMGGASVAIDIFKALLPIFMWWAWRDRRYMFMVPAGLLFVLFSAFSLTSAIGFAASNRGHVSEIKEGANATLKAVRADIQLERSKLANLPKHRPAATVEQQIKALRQNRRWGSTKGCASGEATASASRRFCAGYFTLKSELETAIAAGRIESRISDLRNQETRLTNRGAGGDADPQVSILAKLSGNDQSTVRMALILFVAALLELGSGLGLWIATGHSEIFRRRTAEKSEAVQPAQTVVETPPAPNPDQAVSRETHIQPVRAQVRPEPSGKTSGRTIPEPLEVTQMTPVIDQQEQIAQIQDYLVERLRPSVDGGITLAQLFTDYEQWSGIKNIIPAQQGFFGRVIEQQMIEVGIESDGQQYIGIKLAPALMAPKRATG